MQSLLFPFHVVLRELAFIFNLYNNEWVYNIPESFFKALGSFKLEL